MSRYIDADALIKRWNEMTIRGRTEFDQEIMLAPTIDAIPIEHINLMNLVEVVRCKECRKSHIDGKTTHYLWCTEWGRSTDTFGYCERGEREGD